MAKTGDQMRKLITIAETLNKASTKREWTFYHGTKSDPFDKFIPSDAAKGSQFWNPLGNGMYVTDSTEFARNFGSNVHKVIIPTGSTYKRINMNQWQITGFNLVIRTLKKAFKKAGESYHEWENGVRPNLGAIRKQGRDAVVAFIKQQRPDISDDAFAATTPEQLDDALKRMLKASAEINPEKANKIHRFRVDLARVIRQNSPYEGLYETSYVVEMHFGDQIATEYSSILPMESDKLFGKYDFVVFTETNDVIGTGANGGSALEVVIFNPALQKTFPHRR